MFRHESKDNLKEVNIKDNRMLHYRTESLANNLNIYKTTSNNRYNFVENKKLMPMKLCNLDDTLP